MAEEHHQENEGENQVIAEEQNKIQQENEGKSVAVQQEEEENVVQRMLQDVKISAENKAENDEKDEENKISLENTEEKIKEISIMSDKIPAENNEEEEKEIPVENNKEDEEKEEEKKILPVENNNEGEEKEKEKKNSVENKEGEEKEKEKKNSVETKEAEEKEKEKKNSVENKEGEEKGIYLQNYEESDGEKVKEKEICGEIKGNDENEKEEESSGENKERVDMESEKTEENKKQRTVNNRYRRSYKLSEDCKLVLQIGDITRWFIDGKSDAIVNAANKYMLGGAGVDGAIHSAAGPGLLKACKNIPASRDGVRCPVGEARLTKAFNLRAAYVIHTVGPIYYAEEEPAAKLADSYRSSLNLAKENNIHYIAFPAVSCGIYGCPYAKGAEVSLKTARELAKGLKEIHFILFELPAWEAWLEKADKLFGQVKLQE